MDNFLPFSSSNTNSVQEISMDLTNDSSNFSMIPNHLAQPYPLLSPYSYVACPADQTATMIPQPLHSSEAFPHTQTISEFGSVVLNSRSVQERGGFQDPHMKKMARINRKEAMRRSRNNSCPNSWFNELIDSSRQQVALNMKNNSEVVPREDLYRYSAFDNKKLRVLLVKHLKNSDVGTLGRIVLPKREAEGNLPELKDKEGMILEMRDADSTQSWSFRYKFWSNNKSRMYVPRKHRRFCEEKRSRDGRLFNNLRGRKQESQQYFSIRKCVKQNEGRRTHSMEVNDMNLYEEIMFDYVPNDEDEDSIAMLIGNLNDHYPIPNDLMGLPMEHHQATSSLPPVDHVTDPTHVGSSNGQVSFNDFVW